MSDFLSELGRHPQARRLVQRLGLPIPIPHELRRASGPWQSLPLADQVVVVGGAFAERSSLHSVLAKSLIGAGANLRLSGLEVGGYRAVGEAFGRAPAKLRSAELSADFRADALVFDASTLEEPRALRALYDFFHPLVGRLALNGRVVILGRPAALTSTAAAAATQGALEGFMRSLAKELGRSGSTAQLLIVHPGAEECVEPVLRFVLSLHCAFVTAQPIAIRPPSLPLREPPLVRALVGKVALVTGAARGIGKATARLLAAEGAKLVCVDRPADQVLLQQVARSIGASAIPGDLADPATTERIAAALQELHGGVDVVVHNAGVTRDKTLSRMTTEQWDETILVNLTAVANLDDVLVSKLLRDHGRVICLSSVAGIAGNVGQTNYAAAKAGLIAYVQKRAEVLASRGITVNAVAPGFIETRMTQSMPALVRQAGRRLSALGQGGLARDVGDVITFLASPGALGITGAVVRVCGGALLGA